MPRARPMIDDDNRFFWTSGVDGILRILRCQACGLWLHPPTPVCRRCRSRTVGPEAVSGRGAVKSFTVNHQAWRPDLEVPFVVASVELVEQRGLQLTTNVVDCDPAAVRSGLAVQVRFSRLDDVWLPVFVPVKKGPRS